MSTVSESKQGENKKTRYADTTKANDNLFDNQTLGESGTERDTLEDEEVRIEDDDEEELPQNPVPDKELLFLIEFMVDTLTVHLDKMNVENIDPCALTGPASIALTFLHFPPMYISEKDMDPDKLTGENVVQFNTGKSLMFALTEAQFENPPLVYLLVTAIKEMPHAFRFPHLLIGRTKIELSELFKSVFDKYDENPQKTVSKSIKDNYQLIGEKKVPAGEVSIYIRLTCLGENIVTEFQKPDIENTIMFKNRESDKIYECKETSKPEDSPGKILPGWGNEKRVCGEEPPRARMPPPPDPDDENYEEIYADINGSVIRIKAEKSQRKEQPKQYNVSEFCDCDVPLPQELVAGMSDLSLGQVSNNSAQYQPGTPIRTDKRVGMDSANQLLFRVPPIELLSRPQMPNSITYNVKTCNAGAEHGHERQNAFRVITDNNPEGPPPKMPNDPDKDVFILRVIKRRKEGKKKDAFELEFKIPKEKIEPPPKPPYMIARASGPEKKKDSKKKKKKK